MWDDEFQAERSYVPDSWRDRAQTDRREMAGSYQAMTGPRMANYSNYDEEQRNDPYGSRGRGSGLRHPGQSEWRTEPLLYPRPLSEAMEVGEPPVSHLDEYPRRFEPRTPSMSPPPSQSARNSPRSSAGATGQSGDWDSVDERNNFGGNGRSRPFPPHNDYDPMERFQWRPVARSTYQSNASRMSPFRGTGSPDRSRIAIPTAEMERQMDLTKREERKRRYGGSLEPIQDFQLSLEDAVNLPLDELISKNRDKYSGPSASGLRVSRLDEWDRSGHSRTNCTDARRGTQSKKSFAESVKGDMGESYAPFRKRFREGCLKAKAVVIDGSSVAFEYGGGIHFDWMGIHLCVNYLLELGWSSIFVVVPEDRTQTPGMSKNEHLLKALDSGRYLWRSSEDRNEKTYAINIADRKNAIIISNDVWCTKGIKSSWKYLKDQTFEFEFRNQKTIKFSMTSDGHLLEDVLEK